MQKSNLVNIVFNVTRTLFLIGIMYVEIKGNFYVFSVCI